MVPFADSVDYADFCTSCAKAVENGDCEFGILFCGSGQGYNLPPTKHLGIRCALAWMPEIAALSRGHNNCNMVAITDLCKELK